MTDGMRHLLEYATSQRAIGREATSAELHSIAEVIDCEMRSLKDERDHWMELAHQWEAGASARGFAERLEAAASERADVTLFGTDYTALPVDADGVPIHVGDKVTEHEDGHTFKVDGFMDWDGEWWVFQRDAIQAPARLCTHHAPTVEDVLRDMHAKLDEVTALYVGEAIDSYERDSDEARIFAEYAAKLRLAGEDV